MKGPRELLEHEDHWVTRMGKWFPGERTVFRGRDLHRELGTMRWLSLYLYGITGREFTDPQLKLLTAMLVYTSYPDPRLWNNRVSALAGSVRSTGALALSSAMAVSEATVYGCRAELRAMDFLRRTRSSVEIGTPLDSLVERELTRFRTIPGFGRPVVRGDERIPHLLGLARDLRLDGGGYLALALDVERCLKRARRRLRMNYAALAAALCADLGFDIREYYLSAFPAFLAGMAPCWLEATDSPEGGFLPLACERLAYRGPGRRGWDEPQAG